MVTTRSRLRPGGKVEIRSVYEDARGVAQSELRARLTLTALRSDDGQRLPAHLRSGTAGPAQHQQTGLRRCLGGRDGSSARVHPSQLLTVKRRIPRYPSSRTPTRMKRPFTRPVTAVVTGSFGEPARRAIPARAP